MSWLTDVYGGRLTNSPQMRAGADWAVKRLTEWGMVNAKLELWTNPFGRGWANEKTYFQVTSPNPFPVIAYAPAWTPGTNGMITCELMYLKADTVADVDKYKGKIKDKCLLTEPMRNVDAHWEVEAQRYSDKELEELSQQPLRFSGPPVQTPQFAAQFAVQQARAPINQAINRLIREEGIAVWIRPGRGDGGTVFVGGGGSRNVGDPPAPVTLTIAIEHYGRIIRTLEKNLPMQAEVNVQNKFYDNDLNMFNVIAEIPGTDKADELVMLGGHFDGWHAGTGATDNAVGCAVMIEAMRILKATGLKMRRTVRIGLWPGEEQGLMGSREYVRAHFAEPKDPSKPEEGWNVKPEHAKLSAYYNIDNGTGRIRGIYLQGNEAIAPVFRTWMEPFKNMGMTTLTPRNTGGTDHLSFDAVGLPGFQFIQDEIEYDARTHHSNMDVYERIQENDLKQIATIVAFFVYQTANRQPLMPREPMPPVPPPRRGPGGGPPAAAPPRP
jgi:hypothetical protein